MGARSSPLCLELCCVYVWLCQGGTMAVLISPQSSRAIPSDPRDPCGCRRPRSPHVHMAAAQQHPRALRGSVHRPETSHIISQLGQPKHGKQVVSAFPPTQTGPCTLELCCLTPFPPPIPSPLGCAFLASAWGRQESCNQETPAIHNQSFHPAAVLLHANHDCVIRACALGHS